MFGSSESCWCSGHAHTGALDRDLKQNIVRFGHVLRKFGITSKGLGITVHGLRHEALGEEYIVITGQEPPLRGCGEVLTRERGDAARSRRRRGGWRRSRLSSWGGRLSTGRPLGDFMAPL